MTTSVYTNDEVDLLVIGGGPAGSTVATLVAMQGHRVVLLEQEEFPRHRIGESLIPSTIHGMCKLLEVDEAVHRAGFMRKTGGAFKWGSRPEPWRFSFGASPRLAGSASYAYQVERCKFDDILIKNAAEHGVRVHHGVQATGVLETNSRVDGVTFVEPSGRSGSIRARFTVDASGHQSRLYKKVGGRRVYSDFFRNIAIFGYFEGGARMDPPHQGNIFCTTFDDGWFWYIPLTEDLTSVGAVVNPNVLSGRRQSHEAVLSMLIERAPSIQDMLRAARPSQTPPYDIVRMRRDWSYAQTKFWKPGLALVGDAACFVDPVFSSGVHLAMYSSLLVARSLNNLLGVDPVTEERAMSEFERRYRLEYGLFYEFLVAFYNLSSDEDGYFWVAKNLTKRNASDFEAFVELVGGVASEDASLPGRESCSVPEPLQSATNNLRVAVKTARSSKEMATDTKNPVISIIGNLLREGDKVLTLAQSDTRSKSDRGRPVPSEDRPLYPGGLVPSVDGLSWVEPLSVEVPH